MINSKHSSKRGENDRFQVTSRYAPWLQKALIKMEHSKKTWHALERLSQQESNAQHKLKEQETVYNDVWEAIHNGNLNEVKRFVEVERQNPFQHNENEGGKTMLHIACWHGYFEVVVFLMTYVQTIKGSDAVKLLVNAIDTAYNRCTPILEICRSMKVRFHELFLFAI